MSFFVGEREAVGSGTERKSSAQKKHPRGSQIQWTTVASIFHILKWHLYIVVLEIRNVRPLLYLKPLCGVG